MAGGDHETHHQGRLPTKGRGDENFPVASLLINARLRPHIRAFYDFARAADDIADDPDLAPEEKLLRLDGFAKALASGVGHTEGAQGENSAVDTGPARALAISLAETGVSRAHADDLLTAFRDDAVKDRYADWGQLMAYCRYSAAPCGRFLLELHGTTGDGARAASDALSAALQVINHIQDCASDYKTLDRVYVPLDWMAAEGADIKDLGGDRLSPGLRRVADRMLDRVDGLIDQASALPGAIGSFRLGLEAAVVLALARCLAGRLRAQDPLSERVRLRRWDFAVLSLTGALRGICARLTRLKDRWPGAH